MSNMEFQPALTHSDVIQCTNPSTCNECKQCTYSIPKPASKLNKNGIACEKDTRVKNESCFLHNETCLTIPLVMNLTSNDLTSKCCVVAEMSSCDNGGESVCFIHDAHPVCQCLNGFKGDRCQEVAKQPVVCKCWPGGHQFCRRIDRCEDINADWTECQTTIDTFNCVCNKDDGASKNLKHCLTVQEVTSKSEESRWMTTNRTNTNAANVTQLTLYVLLLAVIIDYITALDANG